MSEREYTRRYFSDGADRWLATAYAGEGLPPHYPVGARRVAAALDAVVARLRAPHGRLLDVGCGGGDLCIAAAGRGFEATGVDIADGMIEEAERRRAGLPSDTRERMRFRVGDALDAGFDAGPCDAVTALGLLEYLEEDTVFFAQAARWLRPGGVLVVSCRNRLFNIASANAYTRREAEAGAVPALLAELAALPSPDDWRAALADLVRRLRDALPDLEAALELDREAPPSSARPGFAAPRRQHTPRALGDAAAAAGFREPAVIALHPHPLPPALEPLAPRTYNRFATAFEALGRLPASLAWSSTFVAVFTR